MTKNSNLIRLIAFYLPQFHPIPENDHWWGKGFTEWTNVVKAKPCFPGHYQPRLPADLGFYDLRVPEVREAQAELAREHGIYGFCYYLYDFSGKKLLEQPFNQVLHSRKPDFPFCLCWANENWTRTWDGLAQEVLIQQNHSVEDDIRFIYDVIPAFKDKRYIRVNGKLLFIVYRAELLANSRSTANRWRDIVKKELQEELYLCTVNQFIKNIDPIPLGFDATIQFPLEGRGEETHVDKNWFATVHNFPVSEIANNNLYDYSKAVEFMVNIPKPPYKFFRGVFPSWDNTARRQNASTIFINSTPELYKSFLKKTIELTLKEHTGDERLIFINAWNEWAEGAYLEPDQKYGKAFLIATKETLEESINTQYLIDSIKAIIDQNNPNNIFIIDQLEKYINNLNDRLFHGLVELPKIQKRLFDTQHQLHDTQHQLHETQGQLHDTQHQLHETQGQLHDMQHQLHHVLNSKRFLGFLNIRSRRFTHFYDVLLKILRFTSKKERNIFACLDRAELISHSIEVSGWALSDKGIERIEVYVDDRFIGNATYGLSRPDVKQVYPSIKNSQNSGFHLRTDVSEFSQAEEHDILIKVIGVDGRMSPRLKSRVYKRC